MGMTGRGKAMLARRIRELGAEPQDEWARAFRREVREQHPPFVTAVLADAQMAARRRGDRWQTSGRASAWFQVLRLVIVGDSFLGQICYRAKAALQRRGVPVVPRIFHQLAIVFGHVCIGDPVVMAPGVYIPHGQVVVDARTRIATGVTLSPFTTLGRVSGRTGGPTLGPMVTVGTGAKIIGPISVGRGARIGANAVVVSDVPADAVAIGVPARIVAARSDEAVAAD